MATLASPLPRINVAADWAGRITFLRTSAWRQTTYPDTEAGESLETARSQRLHIVRVQRDGAAWTFASRPDGGYGYGKRARDEPLNSDGMAKVSKTARNVATYVVETHVGAHPPEAVTTEALAYSLSQSLPGMAPASLVYAVSGTGVSRLETAADALALVLGTYAKPAAKGIGLDAEFGDAWPAPAPLGAPAVVVSKRDHVCAQFEALERQNEAALARELAREPGLTTKRDETLAAHKAADEAYKDADYALARARTLRDKADAAAASARYAFADNERNIALTRACAAEARERAERLSRDAAARLESLDEALLKHGTRYAVLGVLSRVLKLERYRYEDGAARDQALAAHALALSDAPRKNHWDSGDALGSAANRAAPHNLPPADKQWYESEFALPNTAASHVCASVCEHVLARWLARGHTVADLTA